MCLDICPFCEKQTFVYYVREEKFQCSSCGKIIDTKYKQTEEEKKEEIKFLEELMALD
jgi:transcription initiation factor TFIIIB Brf1 subunit/transcription initiation factor TFIIB